MGSRNKESRSLSPNKMERPFLAFTKQNNGIQRVCTVLVAQMLARESMSTRWLTVLNTVTNSAVCQRQTRFLDPSSRTLCYFERSSKLCVVLQESGERGYVVLVPLSQRVGGVIKNRTSFVVHWCQLASGRWHCATDGGVVSLEGGGVTGH